MAVEPFGRGEGFLSSSTVEMAMKTLWIIVLLVAGAMLAAAPMISAAAQDNPKPAATQDKSAAATDPEAPQNQPFMATGLDLKGPPRQFRANQTPE
jgi:hypothetical protein